MKKYDLSVIIPTYNRERCVLNSVNSVLSQETSLSYEVIVVDDGSTDDTWKIFEKIRYKRAKYYRYLDNKGVNYARNFGIDKATGKYIILLDSDDVLVKDAFQKIEKNYDKLKEYNFFGKADVVSGKKLYKTKTGYYRYRDWLAGVVKSGEVTPVVNRMMYEKYHYEEDMFGFLIYFSNQVVREYGVQTFDEILILVSFKEKNRMTKQMHRLEKAHQRYADYRKYCQEYERDYKKYKLYTKYYTNTSKKLFYFCLKKISFLINSFKI